MKRRRKVLVLLGWSDPRILLALARHARESGWHLETRHFFTETVPNGWRGDGMIVSSPQRTDLHRFMLRQCPLQPTVALGGNSGGLPAALVAEDNRAVGRLAAGHLMERGHRRFVWLNTYPGRVADDRRAGFEAALAEAGRRAERLEYRSGRSPSEWSRRRAWLAGRLRALPRPVGLFALDDQLAAEAIEVCLDERLRVPEDVAVVGVGNLELACETSHVPVSSVDLDMEGTALAAARLLDRLMRGGRAPRRPTIIPPRGLVIRSSSSTVAAAHPAVVRAIRHIAQHLAHPLDMDGLAAAAGVSRRTLYNLFAAELARTPADYLRDERLARVRRLLAEGDTPIAEIAAACGFGTIRTLNRVFLQVEKTSPRAWRRGRAGPANESSSRS